MVTIKKIKREKIQYFSYNNGINMGMRCAAWPKTVLLYTQLYLLIYAVCRLCVYI